MVSQTDKDSVGDRRRAPRVAFGRLVHLRFASGRDAVEAVAIDLSVLGMFIGTTCFRQPGEELDFRIDLSELGIVIEGSAEVVRVQGGDESERPSGLGVRFVELPDDQGEAVRSVVDALLRAQTPG